MFLTEVLKNKFLKQPLDVETKEQSSNVMPDNVMIDMTSTDSYPNTGSFFDNDLHNNFMSNSYLNEISGLQKNKIMKYRQLSMTSEVSEAIDEIVNEIVFSFDDKSPLKININEDNEKLREAIELSFDKILKILNVKRNLFSLVKKSYIDGMCILQCSYDKDDPKKGINSIKMIEPCGLYFDIKSQTFKYNKENSHSGFYGSNEGENSEEFSLEEIVREDFGLHEGKINLSYLEYAIKPANMLRTLEDLLIPLRFSRSISRRVFNVDIGDLPTKRGEEVMREYQTKFKYKKFYNNESGEVTNQQHITSMVEDYWFSNRSGGKGTQVDTLDETGNLGEMDDILYYNKKLYRALKIPSSRIPSDPDSDHTFSYEDTEVSKEDMKFFMFISRIRQIYSSLFKELLKREVISIGTMTEAEWDEKEELIEISFVNENKFIEKMNLDNFMSKLNIYSETQEHQGKLFSIETILKTVFKYTDDQITDEFKKIQKEEKDPLFTKFYEKDEEGL